MYSVISSGSVVFEIILCMCRHAVVVMQAKVLRNILSAVAH